MSTRNQSKQNVNPVQARSDQQRAAQVQPKATNTNKRQTDLKAKTATTAAKENIPPSKGGILKGTNKKEEPLRGENKRQVPAVQQAGGLQSKKNQKQTADEQTGTFQNQKNQKLYEKLDRVYGREADKPVTKVTLNNLYKEGHPPPPPPPPEPAVPKRKKGQPMIKQPTGPAAHLVKQGASLSVQQPAAKPGVKFSQQTGKSEPRPVVRQNPSYVPNGSLTARDIAVRGPIPKVPPVEAYKQVAAAPTGLAQQNFVHPQPVYPGRHIVADIPIYMTPEGYSTIPYNPAVRESIEGQIPVNQNLYSDKLTAGYPTLPTARRPAIDTIRYSDLGNDLYGPATNRGPITEAGLPLTYRPPSGGEKRALASETSDSYGAVKRPYQPSYSNPSSYNVDQQGSYSPARRQDLEHLKYSPDRAQQAELEREFQDRERQVDNKSYRPSWAGSPRTDPLSPRRAYGPRSGRRIDSFEEGYSARDVDRDRMRRDIQQWQKEDSWIKEQLSKSQNFLDMNKGRPQSRRSDRSKQSQGHERYGNDEVNRGDSTYRKPPLPYAVRDRDSDRYPDPIRGTKETFRGQRSDRDDDSYRRAEENRYVSDDIGYSSKRRGEERDEMTRRPADQRRETNSNSANDTKFQYVLRTKSQDRNPNSRASDPNNADPGAKGQRFNSYKSDTAVDSRYEDVNEKFKQEEERGKQGHKEKPSTDTDQVKRETSSTMLTSRQSPIGSERVKAQPISDPARVQENRVPAVQSKPKETESLPQPILPLVLDETEGNKTYRSYDRRRSDPKEAPEKKNEPPMTSREFQNPVKVPETSRGPAEQHRSPRKPPTPQTYRQPPVTDTVRDERPTQETARAEVAAAKQRDTQPAAPPRLPEPRETTPRPRPHKERTMDSQGPTRDEIPEPKSARKESEPTRDRENDKGKEKENPQKGKEATPRAPVRTSQGEEAGASTESRDDKDRPRDEWDDLNFDLIEESYPGNDIYVCYLMTDDGAAIGPLKLDIEDVQFGLPKPTEMKEESNPTDQSPAEEEGMRNRQTGSHGLNEFSSRSHSMLMLTIDSEQQDPEDENLYITKRGKLTFVDLAGSEKVKDSNSTAETLIESNNINRSLLVLGNCISSLGDPKRRQGHIPYRDSKLTKLLADSLGGNGVTLMICCITPSSHHAPETINTLRYASRAKKIRSKPVVKMDPREKLIMSLKREIKVLRNENHYLRQQLEFPAKPRGQLQKENDEKFMKLMKEQNERLKQNGATEESGLYEMLQEYMVENESLRTENSEMQVTRDKMRRDQQLLYRDNEKLLKKVDDLERRLNQSVNAWQNMPRQGSYPEQIHSRDHSPRGSPQYVRQGQGSGGRLPAGRLPGYGSPTGSGHKGKQGMGRQPMKPPHRLTDPVPRQGSLEGQSGGYMNGVQSPPYRGNPGSPSKQDMGMRMDSRRSSQSSSSDAIRDMNEKLKAELAQLEGEIHQHQMINGSTRNIYGSQGSIR